MLWCLVKGKNFDIYQKCYSPTCPSHKFHLIVKCWHFPARLSQSADIMRRLWNLITGIIFKLNITSHLALQNVALRQQLIVLKRGCNKPAIRNRDRLFWMLFSRLWRTGRIPWSSSSHRQLWRGTEKVLSCFGNTKAVQEVLEGHRSARRFEILSRRWQMPIRCGGHRGFMVNCLNLGLIYLNGLFQTSYDLWDAGRHHKHGKRFWKTTCITPSLSIFSQSQLWHSRFCLSW